MPLGDVRRHVDVEIKRGDLGLRRAGRAARASGQRRRAAAELLVGHEQVADEHVPFALVHVGAGGRMPAEVVADGAPRRPFDPSCAVDERVLVDAARRGC